MNTTDKYTTIIELNSEQAKRNLEALRKEVEKYEHELAEARKKPYNDEAVKEISKKLKDSQKELRKYDNEVMRTIEALNNLGTASVKEIENAQRQLRKMWKDISRDDPSNAKMLELFEKTNQELENIKAVRAFEQMQQEAVGATKSVAQVQTELTFIKQTADNAETASLKQLQLAERTALNIKNSAQKGSDEWNQASAGLETVRARLTAIEEEEKKVVHTIDRYEKEIKETNKSIEVTQRETQLVNETLSKLSSASVRDIEYSIRILNEQLRDTERTGGNVEALTEKLKRLNAELRKVQDMQRPEKQKEGLLSWLWNGLNRNWGAFTQIIGTITGLSFAIRKSVSDFANMEEQMADVRKYTGLTADQVQELNEELKKMDTRTSREELNQLAGAAGRLGITSQEGILDFVDAADKIGVALGDDLGDGAVDKIGKLAMAFGEDKDKGLRGAMLATGSAINELAQNSSAQAAYLVDFTARVAGFGKQLGLTQAQIMGFGTAMDENLLQDEMAATAFGNMLTKMQTDTAKFAKIAGQSVADFTKLLREDANSAILAVADSLRSQDPTTMMKMLDDMGLDGSRAVAVLATMADKIDDVRRHQQLATDAYEEGTSVIGEFSTMNNTVQAGIDKCKKQFQEMTIELGERLMPVVKYTISSFSLMVKGLSVATSFLMEHKAELLSAAAAIAAYTAYVEAKTIAEKAGAVATKAMTVATELFNKATKLNPVGLLIAALTAAVVLFVKYRDRINGATEATGMLRKAGSKLAGVMAQVAGWMISLVKWAVSLYDKFSFIRKIVQLLATAFTAGFSTITNQVKLLIDELGAVATVIEGIFTLDWKKIKTGYKQGFKAVADAVMTQFNIVKRGLKDTFSAPPPANGAKAVAAGEQAAKGSNELQEVVVTGRRHTKTTPVTDYKTEAEQKKEEAERKKREEEEKKRLKERTDAVKAQYQAELACEMEAYMKGATSYEDYMESRHRLAQKYYDALKKVYGEDSDRYKKLLDDRAKEEQDYNQERAKWTEQSLTMEHLDKEQSIRRQYMQNRVQDEDALNEALFENDIDYMRKKQKLYESDPKKWAEMEMEIQQKQKEEQFQKEQRYMERLARYREEAGLTDYQRLQEIELEGVKSFYGALVKAGQMTQEEYDIIVEHIKRKYAELQGQQIANNDIQSKASKALDTAKKNAGSKSVEAGNDAATGIFSISQAIENQKLINEQLKLLYGADYENNREYQEAKRQLDAETMQQVVAGAQAAYSTISTLMSAASSYAQACSDVEVARITANYDKQIEAAGNNNKKREKLEKEKDKAIAKAKTQANKKAMAMEMAQAIAQTAMGAISAYSSTMAGAPYPANLVLAPISAGIALAAGAIQIATIKKQHEAEAAGYYEGGFTGGKRYRKEAGVVHEGEFVANHQAVENPAILPFLNFLDQAQRNNTVGSLTAADVSRSLVAGGGSPSPIITPIVNVQTDNADLREAVDAHREATEMLIRRLDEGIESYTVMDGPNGLYQNLKKYERLISKK